MYFGKNLKFLMKKRKLIGEDVGKLIGKSKTIVSKHITQTISPSMDDLLVYREVFGVDLETFFFVELDDQIYEKYFNKINFDIESSFAIIEKELQLLKEQLKKE